MHKFHITKSFYLVILSILLITMTGCGPMEGAESRGMSPGTSQQKTPTEKTGVREPQLGEPPQGYILYNDNQYKIARGTYSWTIDNYNGTMTSIEADSDGPMGLVEYMDEMPIVKAFENLEISFEVPPDSYSTIIWYSFDQRELVPVKDNLIVIPEGMSEIIYEVHATWHQGNAYYAFKVIVEGQNNETQEEITEDSYDFALTVDGVFYSLDIKTIYDTLLPNGEIELIPESFPFHSGKRYRHEGIGIETFDVDDERDQGEVIHYLRATKEAETPRGIKIGDTLDDLKSAYENLLYEDDWFPEYDDPLFNRVYVYPAESEQEYLAFFLQNKTIVMIIGAWTLDIGMPGLTESGYNLLGYENLHRENNIDESGKLSYKYFYEDESGKEVVLREISDQYVYALDIDNDGVNELLANLPPKNNYGSLGIYDYITGKVSFMDINEKMGCLWSISLDSLANLKPEYRKCVQLGFENEEGPYLSGIYQVIDNELIYVCPFNNDVLY